MRKDEFLYLHQLLAEVERTLAARGVTDTEAVVETPVSPMAAHAAKDDHEAAVTALASALAVSVADDESGTDDRQRREPTQYPSS